MELRGYIETCLLYRFRVYGDTLRAKKLEARQPRKVQETRTQLCRQVPVHPTKTPLL